MTAGWISAVAKVLPAAMCAKRTTLLTRSGNFNQDLTCWRMKASACLKSGFAGSTPYRVPEGAAGRSQRGKGARCPPDSCKVRHLAV
jgi:hypothetical protein